VLESVGSRVGESCNEFMNISFLMNVNNFFL